MMGGRQERGSRLLSPARNWSHSGGTRVVMLSDPTLGSLKLSVLPEGTQVPVGVIRLTLPVSSEPQSPGVSRRGGDSTQVSGGWANQ